MGRAKVLEKVPGVATPMPSVSADCGQWPGYWGGVVPQRKERQRDAQPCTVTLAVRLAGPYRCADQQLAQRLRRRSAPQGGGCWGKCNRAGPEGQKQVSVRFGIKSLSKTARRRRQCESEGLGHWLLRWRRHSGASVGEGYGDTCV